MNEQLSLGVGKTRADQIFEAFVEFFQANPSVWRLFKQFTFDAINAGRENYSSNAIFERIRWHVDIDINTPGELKLNNNFRAYYARLFHLAYPKHSGFFRNRKRTSENVDAYGDDIQEFVGPDAGPETQLNAKLKTLL